jgi:hypothetical protein
LRIRDAEDNIDEIKSKKLGNEDDDFKGQSK